MLDEAVFHESMVLIAAAALSDIIVTKCYDNSGHLITVGKARDVLAEDVLMVLESLNRD